MDAVGVFPLDRWAPMAYMLFMAERLVTVAETPVFIRQAAEVWTDAEREEFVLYIAGNPGTGDVIPDTGGVRKVRWKRTGTGKRGGVRVIYFYRDEDLPLYLLMVYAKGVKDDLDPGEKKMVRDLAAMLKRKQRKAQG
jgi:hypothetical protein